MVPNPKNAQEALLQIRVIERANAMVPELRKGGEYIACRENGNWTIYKRSGSVQPDAAYLLNLTSNTCSCPFYAENHFCKHLIGLNLFLDAIGEEEQCERAEREMRDCEVETTGCDPFANI